MDNYIFPYHMVSKDANIILYGAGNVGRCFYKQLLTTGQPKLILWVDREAERYRELGYAVSNVECIGDYEGRATVVIAIDDYVVSGSVKKELLSRFPRITEDMIICSEYYWFPDGVSVVCTEDAIKKAQRRRIKGIDNESENISAEENYNQRSLKGRRLIDGKLIKKLAHVELPVRDVILAQYKNHDYSNYQHCDMAVRYLAAEEIINTGTLSTDLYRRMQSGSGFDWTERFIKLVNSVLDKGFNSDTVIELDKNLMIMDGSHRLTLAYYLGVEFIYADIYDCCRDRGFDIDFFWMNRFSEKECELIETTVESILDDCRYEFEGVIWPPAYNIADDIMKDIDLWEHGCIKILSYEDKTYSKEDFLYLFRAIYHPDILDAAGTDIKFKQIERSMGDEKQYSIRRFRIGCDNPMMSVNEKNYLTQSKLLKRLKTTMRARFADRINNYQYDIIMHISDNYLQSRFCEELFSLNRNVIDLVPILNKYPYVVIKAFGRQHEKFPYYYYYGDVDIIVDKQSFDLLVEDVVDYMNEKFHTGWENISIQKKDWSVEIWNRIRDLPIFSVHLQTVEYYGMISESNGWIIRQGIKNSDGLCILPDWLDIYFRAVELLKKPYKEHHRRYLLDHLQLYSEKTAARLLGSDSQLLKAVKNLMLTLGI